MNRNRKGYVMGTSLHRANSKGNKSAFKHGDGTWGGSKTKPKTDDVKNIFSEKTDDVKNIFSEKTDNVKNIFSEK